MLHNSASYFITYTVLHFTVTDSRSIDWMKSLMRAKFGNNEEDRALDVNVPSTINSLLSVCAKNDEWNYDLLIYIFCTAVHSSVFKHFCLKHNLLPGLGIQHAPDLGKALSSEQPWLFYQDGQIKCYLPP